MTRPGIGLAVGLVLFTCAPAAAGEGVIAPDRPDVTDSTQTVPLGVVQPETGVEYARARQAGRPAQQTVDFAGTLRLGLGERIEARLIANPVIDVRDADSVGHGQVGFGLKYRFLDARSWWPSLGIEPSLLFPIALAGSANPDVGVRGLASWELPARFTLDVNAGVAAVAQTAPGGYLAQGLASASFGRQLTEALSSYVELFFASRAERDGRHVLGFDTGVVYLVTRWLALDAAVTTTLSGQGPDVAVQAGISMRFGK